MKNLFLLSTLLITVNYSAFCQDVEFAWSATFGSTNVDGTQDIILDSAGNIYGTGVFHETVDFDPGTASNDLTSSGSSDIFVYKLDSDRNLIWAKNMGGTSDDRGWNIELDDDQNVYISGYFQGTADFDPSSATYELTSVGGEDIFILKLDAQGNFIWVQQIGNTSGNYPNSFSVNSLGEVHLFTVFYDTLDADPGTGLSQLVSTNNNDLAIIKLDNSGQYVWSTTIGCSEYMNVGGSFTEDNVFYLSGGFSGSLIVNPTTSLTSNGASDIFLIKFDGSGNSVWSKSIGGTSYDRGRNINIDQNGDLFLTGTYTDTVDFDPGAGVQNLLGNGFSLFSFLLKLDDSGDYLWAKSFGGDVSTKSHSIEMDLSNNIYLAGSFEGTTDFDPSSNVSTETSTISEDIFVLKLDQNGDFLWTKVLEGTSWEEFSGCRVDQLGNVYVAGSFEGDIDLDPNQTVQDAATNGDFDCFIVKLSPEDLGTPSLNQEYLINIYPNPVNEQFNLNVSGINLNSATFEVRDVNGRLISENAFKQGIQVDVSKEAAGVYFIHLYSENEVYHTRFVKQ